MSCVICNVKCEPWLLLENKGLHTDEEGKSIGKTIQTCGYSCCRKLDPKLPRDYGKLILNKDDFCYWAVPIQPKKKDKLPKSERIYKIKGVPPPLKPNRGTRSPPSGRNSWATKGQSGEGLGLV